MFCDTYHLLLKYDSKHYVYSAKLVWHGKQELVLRNAALDLTWSSFWIYRMYKHGFISTGTFVLHVFVCGCRGEGGGDTHTQTRAHASETILFST